MTFAPPRSYRAARRAAPWLVSATFHLVAIGLLAAAAVGLPRRAEMGGRGGHPGLEVVMTIPLAYSASELAEAQAPVLVLPERTEMGAQQFVFESSSADAATASPPPASAPRRAEISHAVPQPPSPSTSRRGTVSAAVASAAATGIEGRTRARFEGNLPPTYPAAAISSGWGGTVLLRLKIAADGRVTAVEIARSSGHAILDGAAATAVRQWRGEPARVDGVAIESEELLPVVFRPQ